MATHTIPPFVLILCRQPVVESDTHRSYTSHMSDVTRILQEIEAGDSESADQLLPLVYDELKRLAKHRMSGERPDHTLGTTGLVHEAYLRLAGGEQSGHWQGRGHFFAAAAEAMRRILINHARDRARLKRGGGRRKIDLDKIDVAESTGPQDLLDLDEALEKLTQENEQCGQLVKLRFFAGLTIEECANTLGVSDRSAKRYWAYARAWLAEALQVADTPVT